MIHDSELARRTAARVGTVASNIRSISSKESKTLVAEAPQCLTGKSGAILAEQLQELVKDLSSLASGLENIKGDLLAYAARVEEADRKTTEAITGGGGGHSF